MTTKHPIVAIIDDEIGMRNALKNFLSAYGYETEIYASARALLDAVTTTVATCFIVDVQLGDSCGFDLARALAGLGFSHPIIFMTGNESESYERRAREAGCAAFLRKPFSLHLLIEVLVKLPMPRAPGI